MIFFWLPGFPAGPSPADLIIYATNAILKLQQLIISTSNTIVTRTIITLITSIVVIIVCLLKRLTGFQFQSPTDAAIEENFQDNTGDVSPGRPGQDSWGMSEAHSRAGMCLSQGPGAPMPAWSVTLNHISCACRHWS